jgi:hypothetical protein
MDQSQWIGVRSQEFRDISERILVATRLSSKLSGYCWDEADLGSEPPPRSLPGVTIGVDSVVAAGAVRIIRHL